MFNHMNSQHFIRYRCFDLFKISYIGYKIWTYPSTTRGGINIDIPRQNLVATTKIKSDKRVF